MLFIRRIIFVFLISNCFVLISQTSYFSHKFDALKSNVPVAIINKYPHYFNMLRYNKKGHDMTIERRTKPGCDIVAFTPLKLDSINASWFDYEELDYLFFEHKHYLYFLFEKVINSKKTLYVKIIDSLGKSSGFIELASIEKDKAFLDFEFSFKKVANDNVLIIASRTTYSGSKRQVAMLFNVEKRKMEWTKKLPVDDLKTDFSMAFNTNHENDLYYLLSKNTIIGYEYFYVGNIKHEIPEYKTDSLFLIKWSDTSHFPKKKLLELKDLSQIKTVFISPQKNDVLLMLQGVTHDSIKGITGEFFLNIVVPNAGGSRIYNFNTFDSTIQKQLNFYDGPRKEPWFKRHFLFANYAKGDFIHTISERHDKNYYKEILYRKTEISSGRVVSQKLIPRKLFFFSNRSRYKNVTRLMIAQLNEGPGFVMLEEPGNFKKNPSDFVYRNFKKEDRYWNSNVVMYSFTAEGTLKKELIYHNSQLDLIPLQYDGAGNSTDMVFYLTSGFFEKFLIWKPN